MRTSNTQLTSPAKATFLTITLFRLHAHHVDLPSPQSLGLFTALLLNVIFLAEHSSFCVFCTFFVSLFILILDSCVHCVFHYYFYLISFGNVQCVGLNVGIKAIAVTTRTIAINYLECPHGLLSFSRATQSGQGNGLSFTPLSCACLWPSTLLCVINHF